jgi:PKD repeat protein
MLKSFFFALGLLSLSLASEAQDQTIRYCGQPEAWDRIRHAHPLAESESRMAEEYLERWTEDYAADRSGGDLEIYIIPVVFHIIHDNGPENIDDDQVLNALSILNRDFRKLNTDVSLVVDAFQDITADIGIEFRLATKDPNGNCTTGINRIVSDLTYEGDDEMKSLIYWPRNKYLNVWICSDAAGAAGYTNLPGNVNAIWLASSDGIVIRSDYTGSIGTSSASRSRTLTHEVGHWLNLYHTWGSGNTPAVASNCNQDDNVSDTPNTIGWTECSLTGASCNNTVDNVQNYMEYSYCSRMFTEGQATRMRAAILSSVAQRNQLITPTNHANTGVVNPPLCVAQFSVSRTNVCVGEPIEFTDASYHGVSQWTWNFGDGTVIAGSDPELHQSPEYSYSTPGTYTVTLTVGNGMNTLQSTQQNVVTIVPLGFMATPVQEGFEGVWPEDRWFVVNPDNYVTWEVTPAAASSGTKSVRIRNFSNVVPDATDELISSTIDMAGEDTVYVSYKWAYANKLTATDDRLRIYVSGDCGDTWELIRLRRGTTNLPTTEATSAQFVPAEDAQWMGETLTITNPESLTESFRLKIDFVGKGGNNIYLDDINIWTIDEVLVGMNELSGVNGLSVYPNPSGGDMALEFAGFDNSPVRIELIDPAGRLCFATTHIQSLAGLQRVVIPQQTAGVYILRLQSSSGVVSRRLIFR